MKNPSRLHRLRETLEDEELDGILISTPENRRYVSGFAGTAGYLLVSQSDAVLATDFRYVEQAERQAPEFRIERISEPGWLPGLAREAGAKRPPLSFGLEMMRGWPHRGDGSPVQARILLAWPMKAGRRVRVGEPPRKTLAGGR